jgi:hypothetical protein
MNSYQKEQLEALALVQGYLANLALYARQALVSRIADYLLFRDDVDAFLDAHFSDVCTLKCFKSRISACCSRDGIITFFGDVVVNVLVTPEEEINALRAVLQKPNKGFKCVYLGKQGCMWRVKPIVCEMFLCKSASQEVLDPKSEAAKIWEALKQRKKLFTWPDRPVLFDDLERVLLDAGYSSSLMYMHTSPGLLRIKKQAQKRKK